MDKRLRESFNLQFTKEKYEAYCNEITIKGNHQLDFRIAETPVFIPKKIINEKRADIETLAKALLEYETLSGDEIKDLLAGIEIRKVPTQILEVPTNSQSAISAINNDKIDQNCA